MKHFKTRPSSRKAPGAQAKWLVLGYLTAGMVARGERKVHILPVKPSDHRKRFATGQRLQVKGFVGGAIEARVVVEAAERVQLRAVDFKTARAFGARHLDDFRSSWVEEHDERWRPDGDGAWEGLALARFDARWAHKDVWVIHFTVDRSQPPRLLAASSDELYVETAARALRDEMPALTVADYELHIAKPSRSLAVEREKARRMSVELLTDVERLEVVKRDAARKGVDISRELRALDFRRTHRGIGGTLEALERKVYRVAA